MVLVIQMCMLMAGALIVIITRTNPASISKNEVFRSGMIAIVAVYGVAWMAETMFGAHLTQIEATLGVLVKEYPWAYALILLLVSKFVNSQAAALAALVPVALAIGVNPAYIVASAPPATVIIFYRPTPAIWRQFSSTAPAPPASAAS